MTREISHAVDPRSTLRWAIVGTGMVSHHVAEDLSRVPGAEPFAVASRDSKKGEDFANAHRLSHAGSLRDILRLPDVDVVYIATPHATHHAIARQALMAGKHVIIEKPAVMTEEEAEDLRQLAAVTHAFLMEAMWMKFSAAYRGLLDFIAAGHIGRATSVRASFGLPFPRDGSSRWNAELGGSALLDQGIYPVTLALDVLGAPSRLTAAGVRQNSVDVSQHMTFEYDDGRHAHLASSMVEFIDPTASVSGTEGWVHVPFPFWAATEFTSHTADPATFLRTQQHRYERDGNGYVPMLHAANDAIVRGQLEHPRHRWQNTVDVLRILHKIRAHLTSADVRIKHMCGRTSPRASLNLYVDAPLDDERNTEGAAR